MRRAWITLLLAGCAGDPADSGDCGRAPPLDWENFGEGVMNKHCTGCHSSLLPTSLRHGAPPGVDLDTYAGAVAWAERVQVRALERLDMPPGGGLADEELGLMAEWLACGVLPDAAATEGR